jgi:hypothetical protein
MAILEIKVAGVDRIFLDTSQFGQGQRIQAGTSLTLPFQPTLHVDGALLNAIDDPTNKRTVLLLSALLKHLYQNGASYIDSIITLDATRQGIVIDRNGVTPSGSLPASGLHSGASTLLVFGVMDSSQTEPSVGGPMCLWGITPDGHIRGQTVNFEWQNVPFIADADTRLFPADSQSIEGGDIYLVGGKAKMGGIGPGPIYGWGGEARIYGGEGDVANGSFHGGVIIDTGAPQSQIGPAFETGNAPLNHISIGCNRAPQVNLGNFNSGFAFQMKANNGMYFYVGNGSGAGTHTFQLNNGLTASFDPIATNSDGQNSTKLLGYFQISVETVGAGGGVYKFTVNAFTGFLFANATSGKTLATINDAGLKDAKTVGTQLGATLHSAGTNVTIAPDSGIHKVDGTGSVQNITPPYSGFIGSVKLIPTGVWTLSTGGNISLAAAAVVGKPMEITFDGTGSCYPSYT